MNVSKFKGNWTISFINSTLSADQITKLVSIGPTSVTTKGQVVSSSLKVISNKEIWMYKEKIIDPQKLSNTLDSLVKKLNIEGIYQAIDSCEESILNLYLSSEYGQFGFELSQDDLIKISSLKVKLAVHIISFGGVE